MGSWDNKLLVRPFTHSYAHSLIIITILGICIPSNLLQLWTHLTHTIAQVPRLLYKTATPLCYLVVSIVTSVAWCDDVLVTGSWDSTVKVLGNIKDFIHNYWLACVIFHFISNEKKQFFPYFKFVCNLLFVLNLYSYYMYMIIITCRRGNFPSMDRQIEPRLPSILWVGIYAFCVMLF